MNHYNTLEEGEYMENEIMDLSFYSNIKNILDNARKKAYSAVNFAMVEAYWEIGKSIVEKQGGNETAEYGKRLLKELYVIICMCQRRLSLHTYRFFYGGSFLWKFYRQKT